MQLIDRNHINHQIENGYTVKTSEYLSKGYAFLKENFGQVVGLSLLATLIPLASLITQHNLPKVFNKIETGNKSEAMDEVFKFDKTGELIIHFILVILGMFIIFLPFTILFAILGGIMEQGGGDANPLLIIGMIVSYIFIFIAAFSVATLLYFSYALIVLGDYSAKDAIKTSYALAKKNFFPILGLNLLIGLVATLGAVACYIGMFITIPLALCMQYFSYKDILYSTDTSEIDQITGV